MIVDVVVVVVVVIVVVVVVVVVVIGCHEIITALKMTHVWPLNDCLCACWLLQSNAGKEEKNNLRLEAFIKRSDVNFYWVTFTKLKSANSIKILMIFFGQFVAKKWPTVT